MVVMESLAWHHVSTALIAERINRSKNNYPKVRSVTSAMPGTIVPPRSVSAVVETNLRRNVLPMALSVKLVGKDSLMQRSELAPNRNQRVPVFSL